MIRFDLLDLPSVIHISGDRYRLIQIGYDMTIQEIYNVRICSWSLYCVFIKSIFMLTKMTVTEYGDCSSNGKQPTRATPQNKNKKPTKLGDDRRKWFKIV